jgi:hypothetical protein
MDWPSGRSDEFKNAEAGKGYQCIEGKGLAEENKV